MQSVHHRKANNFADGLLSDVGVRSTSILDTRLFRDGVERATQLAIVAPDDVFRFLAIQRGFPKLSNPELRRMLGNVEVKDVSRMQFDDEEDIEM